MSVCLFLASDVQMPEIIPPQEYPVHVDIDKGTIFDGGADDNFSLRCFASVADYTEKVYGVCLEWVYYTDGRANKLIDYIKGVLKETDCVEMWCVWLTDYYEYEDRPFIHNKSISIADLTETHIKEMDNAEIWNKPDRNYPDRPSFYRLTIHR